MEVVRTVAARLVGTRKGARRSLVVAALAALLLGTAATPAHAAPWYTDDLFENNPQNQWTIYGAGGHFSSNPQWAYSGSGYAYLVAWPADGYGSGLTKQFYLPSQHWRACRVSVMVRAVNNDALVILTGRKPGSVNVGQDSRLLRPSDGWQGLSAFPVPADWGMLMEVTIFMQHSHSHPVDIRVDDFRIWCWT